MDFFKFSGKQGQGLFNLKRKVKMPRNSFSQDITNVANRVPAQPSLLNIEEESVGCSRDLNNSNSDKENGSNSELFRP